MTKVKEAATAPAQTRCMARLPSPAMLMRAPHRLLFFIGASNLLLALAGWSAGLIALGRVLKAAGPPRNWHARACYAALLLGWLGLLLFMVVVRGHATLMPVTVALGTFGLLLPVYLTVAHRMIPFFANNVVDGYVPWRPLCWLAAMWVLLMLRLLLSALQVDHLLWLADAPLLLLSLQALWHWWPRGPMPGLLAALFLALAWLPISFALYLLQDIGHLLGHPQLLGRAPLHALAVGLFGSLLVAMVTRVTQGHSGRPLVMPAVAWFAFVALQVVAIMRIVAELMPDAYAWHFAAAIGWLLALALWVARLGWIYLSPRRDGKPG